MKYLVLTLLTLTLLSCKPQTKILEISTDGTWCWFSDQRAILDEANKQIITGYVKEDGTVAALNIDINTLATTEQYLFPKLEVDDHNNPAFVKTADNSILGVYTKHHREVLLQNKMIDGEWSTADTINVNSADQVTKYSDDHYTYANPYCLKDENNRIYMFGRWVGFKPNIAWSDDNGSTWSDGKVMIVPDNFTWLQRPYVKYYSDGNSRIHIVFTDGHPRQEKTNSVYYVYLENGYFHRSNGDTICSLENLPFKPEDATLVYDGKITNERAWIYDIYASDNTHPVIAYAKYPTEEEHIYCYAWFEDNKWNSSVVVNSGKWFPETPEGEHEREPHYSAGLTINPNKKHDLFISRDINGIYEIEEWTLDTDKNKWSSKAITQNSLKSQVRPFTVKAKGEKTYLMWLTVDRYIHYTNFKTGIKLAVISK